MAKISLLVFVTSANHFLLFFNHCVILPVKIRSIVSVTDINDTVSLAIVTVSHFTAATTIILLMLLHSLLFLRPLLLLLLSLLPLLLSMFNLPAVQRGFFAFFLRVLSLPIFL